MGYLTPAKARQRLVALGAAAFIQASKVRRVTAKSGTGVFHMPHTGHPGGLDLDCRASEAKKCDHRGERETWLFWASEVCYSYSSITRNSALSPQALGVTGRGILSEMSFSIN